MCSIIDLAGQEGRAVAGIDVVTPIDVRQYCRPRHLYTEFGKHPTPRALPTNVMSAPRMNHNAYAKWLLQKKLINARPNASIRKVGNGHGCWGINFKYARLDQDDEHLYGASS